MLLFLSFSAFSTESKESGTEKYFNLRKLYYLWTENFYRGDSYYFREIRSTLYSYVDTEFTTPLNYTQVETVHGSKDAALSKFRFSSWLVLMVNNNEPAIKEYKASLSEIRRKRGGSIGITGTVYKYHVVNRENERTVQIYLQNIRIILPPEKP